MAKLIVTATSLSFEICTFYSLSWTNCIGAYDTDRTAGGITQWAHFWVTVRESLFSTPVEITQRRDPTWEHDFPKPAMQSQCAARIFPSAWLKIHGVSGFSDNF